MTNLENLLRPDDIKGIGQMSFGQQKLNKLSKDSNLLKLPNGF